MSTASRKPRGRSSTPTQPRKRATLKDLALALNVAPSTISNAYNRPDQLSQELRERILATARDMGYSGPHPVARGLRQQKTNTVGVIFAEQLSYAFHDPVAATFLEGVSSAIEAAGLSLLLLPAVGGQKPDPSAVLQAAVDGFVVYSMTDDHPLIRAALERHLPIVLADQPAPPGIPSVTINDEHGAFMACKHLLERGHKRFGLIAFEFVFDGHSGPITPAREALLAGPSCPPSRERMRGYKRAIQQARLSWKTTVKGFECAKNSIGAGRAAAEWLLEHHDFTALLCMSDQLALGALEALQAHGKRVPTDVAVVGFDDIPAAINANLSTVFQPHLEKGRLAGELLVARLRGEHPKSPKPLPTRLIVRGSSGEERKVKGENVKR